MCRLPWILISFALLGACASGSVASVNPPTEAGTRPQSADTASLEELTRLEHERPRDPSVKMRLATRHACENRSGLAVDHWLWVRQFASETAEAQQAAKLYAAANRDPAELRRLLGCAR